MIYDRTTLSDQAPEYLGEVHSLPKELLLSSNLLPVDLQPLAVTDSHALVEHPQSERRQLDPKLDFNQLHSFDKGVGRPLLH